MRAIPTQRETPRAVSEAPARACARADAALSGGSLAPGTARALVRSALADWTERALPGAEHLTTRAGDDATLIASELVTNAVVHAGTEVRLTCRLEEESGALVVEVTDRHPSRAPHGGEPEAPPYESPEHGRGLRLVAALSEAWGITYRPGTKTVWARIPVGGGFAADGTDGSDGAEESAENTEGVQSAEGMGVPFDAYVWEAEPEPGGEGWRVPRPYRRDGAWLGRGRCPSSPRRPICSPGSWTRTWSPRSPGS
ncbi:ATP-binding protein [Streptomyces sp. INA 01156]